MNKYIFCTGGVVSSLGKGVTAASLGRILKSRGVSVSVQKLDPYLNVDPGTMSPYEHGEVFVLNDGAETDLDLGAYERFIDENLTRASNVTSGQVYQKVIACERRGDYLGKTIQVIPHVTNMIKASITQVARESGAEVVIVEVGGTVGDIESLPFLEALRQMRKDLGRDNTLYIHVTLLPHIGATGELKTKPTQHSVRELRSIGIQPDVIVCRADYPVDDDLREKIALFCDVEERAVVPLPTAQTIYEVPLMLEEAGLGDFVVERLGLPAKPADLAEWRALVGEIKRPKPALRVAIVGKYIELHDAYTSVREALYHAAVQQGCDLDIAWVSSEHLERGRDIDCLEKVDGIVVPGGFGYRGIDEPNSTEFDVNTKYPVIDLMPEQRDIADMGGTMRLGIYPCRLVKGTQAYAAYSDGLAYERHRHRFEFNNVYRKPLAEAGMVYSGLSPDERLVEIAEMRDHPFMLGSQFHPEFRSRPTRPHPLFSAFIRAVQEQADRPAEPPASG
jgi:CTP synthase